MNFKATLSRTSVVLTGLVFLLLVAVPIALFGFAPEIPFLIKLAFLLPLVFALLVSWGLSVRGYKLEKGELIIFRLFGNKVFQTRDIRFVESVDVKKLRRSFRIFGNGGFWGYSGTYYNWKLGRMTWYATNLKNAILLTFYNNKKILITPDASEEMIMALGADKKPTRSRN